MGVFDLLAIPFIFIAFLFGWRPHKIQPPPPIKLPNWKAEFDALSLKLKLESDNEHEARMRELRAISSRPTKTDKFTLDFLKERKREEDELLAKIRLTDPLFLRRTPPTK